MKEPTKYVNYAYLLKRLRQKYHPTNTPRIYLVEGRFPVAHEGGYDWIVGYCDTIEEAEAFRQELVAQLKNLRRQTGKLYAAQRNASLFYEGVRFGRGGVEVPEEILKRMGDAWIDANNAFRDKVDEILVTMFDKEMPWPYSHLFKEQDSCDGPINYYIKEVIKCPNLT